MVAGGSAPGEYENGLHSAWWRTGRSATSGRAASHGGSELPAETSREDAGRAGGAFAGGALARAAIGFVGAKPFRGTAAMIHEKRRTNENKD